AVRALGNDRAVDFAEPNWVYQHQSVSNDTYVTSGQLWGMTGTYGSQAVNAWAEGKTDCSGVYVGIIDEGFMYDHEDIAANAWINPFDAADGVDNDGNGYVDDVHGWDFDGGDNSTFDGATDDHGTHVSGTIAGHGGNGKGVAGVCWSGVKLISAKFLGRRGGTTANAILAVDYLTDLKLDHGLNIAATNNSWGGGGFSQGLLDAINRANAADILFIAAAGNSGADNDATASYPSNYAADNVIAVAALASNGTLASYSQYGLTTVDLGAPGSAIYSSVPKSSKGLIISSYASYSGTSMATPHVTGAVALFKSLNPAASAAAIKAAILNQSTPTASLTGKTVTGGRLDVSGF
ncbi:MAG: S8 family peptidase, partial [Arenimonas sp.]